jgi:hypothetical protein
MENLVNGWVDEVVMVIIRWYTEKSIFIVLLKGPIFVPNIHFVFWTTMYMYASYYELRGRRINCLAIYVSKTYVSALSSLKWKLHWVQSGVDDVIIVNYLYVCVCPSVFTVHYMWTPNDVSKFSTSFISCLFRISRDRCLCPSVYTDVK